MPSRRRAVWIGRGLGNNNVIAKRGREKREKEKNLYRKLITILYYYIYVRGGWRWDGNRRQAAAIYMFVFVVVRLDRRLEDDKRHSKRENFGQNRSAFCSSRSRLPPRAPPHWLFKLLKVRNDSYKTHSLQLFYVLFLFLFLLFRSSSLRCT